MLSRKLEPNAFIEFTFYNQAAGMLTVFIIEEILRFEIDYSINDIFHMKNISLSALMFASISLIALAPERASSQSVTAVASGS